MAKHYCEYCGKPAKYKIVDEYIEDQPGFSEDDCTYYLCRVCKEEEDERDLNEANLYPDDDF